MPGGIEHLGVEPKIGVCPPKSSILNRVFHYFHYPFSGFPPYIWKHPFLEAGGWELIFVHLLLKEYTNPLGGEQIAMVMCWGGRETVISKSK